MNDKLETVQHKFLGRIGQMSDAFGLNGFIIKIYGFLYLNAKPFSLDEITEALGVSKGNVSINIRELERWGAVRKIWVKGSRKDYYEAELDIKKVFSNRLKSSIQKRISEVSGMIEEFKRIISSADTEFSDSEKALADGYLERFKKIEEIKSLVSRALILADKLL